MLYFYQVMKMKENIRNYLNTYKEVVLFQGIEENDILSMLECFCAYIKNYQKNEFIIFLEEHVNCVGIVLEGNVLMVKEDLFGNKTTMVNITPKEQFGETFACGSTLQATVSFVAGSDTKVLYLPYQKILHSCKKACEAHYRLNENLVTLIANKNIQLMQKIDVITKKTLREKIIAFLMMQGEKKKSQYFSIDMGRIKMAEYLCADRSALTRELKQMRLEGLIDYDKNMFRILKPLN